MHLKNDPFIAASPRGLVGARKQWRPGRGWAKRLLVLAVGVFLLGSPATVFAAGSSIPPLPSLPEVPQADDPTVVAFSILHGPEMGSASCYGNPSAANCNGTNPMTVACSIDAYTVFNTQTPIYDQTNGTLIGYLELRYSPHCGTNWARSTFTNPAYINPLYQRDTFVAGAAGRADDFFNDESVRYSAEIYAPSSTMCAHVTVQMGVQIIAAVQGVCA